MDQTEVTNDQFAKFVKATRYVTLAERPPRVENFPGAPMENLVAGSVVFTPPDHSVKLNNHFQWWSYVKGANWRHPEGPQSSVKDRANYPVVYIAYEDALAYAKWVGKRLPTEAKFEFAQRSELDRKPSAWGDELKPGGKFMANTFQGHFPDKNTKEDGYERAAPVASFPPNGYGLYDMAGNVWEWTRDWYRHDYYQALAAQEPVAHNPQGPKDSVDPSEPGVKKKVHKGGSFLCTDQYCARYTVAATQAVPAGKAAIRFEFAYDGGGLGKGGTGTLFVNGKKIATGRIDKTQFAVFSADEGADVGADEGTPVTEAYKVPFKFTGKIAKVTIELQEMKAANIEAEQHAIREARVRKILAD